MLFIINLNIKMEKDTVLLSVEKYNELRDFKNEVEKSFEESKFAVIEQKIGYLSGGMSYSRKYYTEDEVVADFEKRNNELEGEIEELYDKKVELEAEIEELNNEKVDLEAKFENSINDLKKMSYWEFRKWRKS